MHACARVRASGAKKIKKRRQSTKGFRSVFGRIEGRGKRLSATFVRGFGGGVWRRFWRRRLAGGEKAVRNYASTPPPRAAKSGAAPRRLLACVCVVCVVRGCVVYVVCTQKRRRLGEEGESGCIGEGRWRRGDVSADWGVESKLIRSKRRGRVPLPLRNAGAVQRHGFFGGGQRCRN
jgi:hypothetical protein